jgi:hypothetical protein
MTIGIALALHDCVLLVADGVTSTEDEVTTREAEKIVPLRDDVALIVFGAEIGTKKALTWICESGGLPRDADAARHDLNTFVYGGGRYVLQSVPLEQRTSPRLKVGLIAGGIDTNGPYIAGAIYGSGMNQPSSDLARSISREPQQIILGGESIGAHEHFKNAAGIVTKTLGPLADDSKVLLPYLLDVAEQTVRFAEARDRTIGGRITYRILRPNQPPETGFR